MRSREILFENDLPAGDPRHAQAGEPVLEALLKGTDAEGYAGDRSLVLDARARLATAWGGGSPGVVEAYRMRNAERVEVVFIPAGGSSASVSGLPGRWVRGMSWAVEVTRADQLAFRVAPTWRRADAPGWVIFDAGDLPAVARNAGGDALLRAHVTAVDHGLAVAREAGRVSAARGLALVEVERALATTSLPLSVRSAAAASLKAPRAALGVVVAALAGVGAGRDREEGEAYARAAGRLFLRADLAVIGGKSS